MAYSSLVYTAPFQYAKLKYPEVDCLMASVIPHVILQLFFTERQQFDCETVFQVS